MNKYPGHILIIKNAQIEKELVQTAAEHCRQVASYAQDSLIHIGLGTSAYLAGLLHDCGKFTSSYAAYLQKAVHGEPVSKGSVNHTFAGVRYLLKKFHSQQISLDDVCCELIAYAVGAHHGLFDLATGTMQSGFSHRMTASIEEQEAINGFVDQCATAEELTTLFQQATEELRTYFENLIYIANNNQSHRCFYFGLLARLLLSAVIEGDHRDTAEFMTQKKQLRLHLNREKSYQTALSHLEQKLEKLSQDKPINKARGKISDMCREMAEKTGGLYALNVPTGAGKTLTSLRYALAHSIHHKKQRIFFIMPLLSIIEQNSTVIEEYIGDPSLLLEHHSNVVLENATKEEISIHEILTESWDAPITITTLVQFLETLFSGKTRSIRRFQSLCNSVIIIDEVQTVPSNMLTLFNLAINFLVVICNATVVLCSATQPTLEKADHPLFCTPQPIVPYDAALWQVFSRTNIIDAGAMQLCELPNFIEKQIYRVDSVLVICNKKSTATQLYSILQDMHLGQCFHLSASMCMAHRRDTMEQMKSVLDEKRANVICIATQVMEAGVDISFGCVIRMTAGMDSIVQAAGRCNRNGESEIEAPVYVVHCLDEQLTYLREILEAQHATEELLAAYRQNSQQFSNHLASDRAISYYYHRLYQGMKQEYQDFYVDTAKTTIFEWLSRNKHQVTDDSRRFFLQQAFDTAGKHFHVFDADTIDVLVPYGVGADIIAELGSKEAAGDIGYMMELTRRAKPYSISAFSYQAKALSEKGAIYTIGDKLFYVLQPSFYHPQTGLIMEGTTCDILIL